MPFELDTSGRVVTELSEAFETYYEWGDLDPFVQDYIVALATENYTRVAALPSDNDGTGHCRYCGRDNRGEERGPCSDDCPRQSIAFSDLAPETLLRIIADCEWLIRAGWHNPKDAFDLRQKGVMPGQQALTIAIADGKIVFA